MIQSLGFESAKPENDLETNSKDQGLGFEMHQRGEWGVEHR